MKKIVILACMMAFMLVAVSGAAVMAKGTPWDIEFTGNADGDGGSITIVVTLNNGTVGTINMNVPPNATPQQKASFLAGFLDPHPQFESSVRTTNNRKVKVEVQDDWANDDEIKSIKITDNTTGEGVHGVIDDPNSIIVRVMVDITGTGVDREDGGPGTASLGIGGGPLATVPTGGYTGEVIEEMLVDEFNLIYVGVYTASLVGDRIVIPNVPCEEGSWFGTDDNGLVYDYITQRVGGIPTLTEWGLIIMFLVMAAGIVWFVVRQRRRVVPA